MNRKISEYKNARHLLTFRSRKTKQKFPFFLVGMSFLIPILLLLPGLIYMGIFPFGDLTTLTVDLRNQYVGFFEAMRNALQDPGSLLYNFTKGLGGVMSGTVAYYLTSPLNLLIFLFPSKDLPMAIELIQLLKVGLAGAFFAIFLIKKEHGDSILVLLFSVPYALMGFVVANLLNLMWLDPILLLPLIILMLERMFDGKSAIPYILLLAWSILTNFYAAYMLCLFLGLYAIWALIRRSGMHTRTRKAALKNAWHQFVYFGFSSLVAALLCAVILLPTGYSLMMSKGPYQDLIQYRWSNAYPWLDPLSRLFPAAFDFDQVSHGFANIFTGTFSIFALFLYFVQPHILKREKFASLFLLLFLLLSMNMRILNLLWHGMQYPIWYNFRFSWVYGFFVLLLGFRGIRRMRRMQGSSILLFSGFYLALIAYFAWRIHSDPPKSLQFLTPYHLLAMGVLLVLLVLILLQFRKKGPSKKRQRWLLALFVLSFLELTVNAAFYTGTFNYESASAFSLYDQEMNQALKSIRPDEQNFYRIGSIFQHDGNDGMRFGFSSLSHFNSTYEYDTVEFLSSLGLARARASTNGGNATKFIDAFFGTRYYLAPHESERALVGADQFKAKVNRPDLEEMPIKNETSAIEIHENPWSMPLGMLAEAELPSFEVGRRNPIDLQDAIANMIDGKANTDINYFALQPLDDPELENLKQSESKDQISTLTRVNADETIPARLNYTIHTNGHRSAYLTISETFNADNSTLYLNGEKIKNKRTGSVSTSQVLNVASANQPEQTQTLAIEMKNSKKTFRLNHMALFELDEEALKEAVHFQQKNGLQISSFRSTQFKGSFHASEQTPYLLLSMPYDQGWSATIDGKTVEPIKALGALTALPVSPGSHTLIMTYHLPYLKTGIIVSGIAAITLIFLAWTEHRSNSNKKGKPQS